MRHPNRHRLVIALLAAGIVLLNAGSAFSGAIVAVDEDDGFTFPIKQQSHTLSGKAPLPLGTNYALVESLIEIFQTAPAAGSVRAIFPGKALQTIEVNTGDLILFESDFPCIDYKVRITDDDPVNSIGEGIGESVEFPIEADRAGSGVGYAKVTLANLGLLSSIQSLGESLGNPIGVFGEHKFGVDLNGDGFPETMRLNNFVYSFFDNQLPPTAGWNYKVLSTTGGSVVINDPFNKLPASWQSSGFVNPNFGISLDVVEWRLTQDLLIAGIPEPSTLTLARIGALTLLTFGVRFRT